MPRFCFAIIPVTSRSHCMMRPASTATSGMHLRADQRITRICGQAFGFGNAKLFPDDVRPTNERNDLIECVAAAHSFTTHSAIGTYDQAFCWYQLHRLSQQVGHFLGTLDL